MICGWNPELSAKYLTVCTLPSGKTTWYWPSVRPLEVVSRWPYAWPSWFTWNTSHKLFYFHEIFKTTKMYYIDRYDDDHFEQCLKITQKVSFYILRAKWAHFGYFLKYTYFVLISIRFQALIFFFVVQDGSYYLKRKRIWILDAAQSFSRKIFQD